MRLPCVGKRDAPEETIGDIFLVELSGSLRGRSEGEVYPEHGIARYAISRGAQGSGSLTVEDVSHHLAHLLVAAADSICHLHLRQVEVLRSLAQFLACHGILYEG